MTKETDTTASQSATAIEDATERRSDTERMHRDVNEPLPRTLRSKFVLEKRLGDGGMGTVYKALDLEAQLHRDPNPYVALKTLNADVLRNFPNARTALQREASRARQITHQNIIRVYDFFDVSPPDNECFITMELLEGQTLDALLKAHPRGLSKRHAFFLLEGICQGLQYAHDRGFVHSDLKPSNIFLTSDGTIRILDLGIATPIRDSSGSGKKDTIWNPRALGALTPAYASLEQWLRMDADRRDDVYSLAVMTYEMLTGKHPFEAKVDGKLEKLPAPKASKAALSPPRIRSLHRPQNAALARALRFERDERTGTVDQFYAEISEGESDVKRGALWLGAAAAGLFAVSVGAWIALRGDRPIVDEPRSSNETINAPAVEPNARPVADSSPSEAQTLPDTATESTSRTPAPPVQPNATESSDAFRNKCRVEASREGLDQLIDRGLGAQTAITFGGSADTRAELATISATASCIRELGRIGIQSNQGNQWVKDAAALLEANKAP